MGSSVKNRIGIIGAGFSGIMTAVNLIKNSKSGIDLYLINDTHPFGKGIAYSSASSEHLLNVPAAKMSCFPSNPNHFLEWVHKKHPYYLVDKDVLGKMFLPRKEYGNYLIDVWNDTIRDKSPGTGINIINARAEEIKENGRSYSIKINGHDPVEVDFVVLATGNELPANPGIKNRSFFESKRYFKNPWSIEAMIDLKNEKDILIIGSGLTMADTVLSLMGNNFRGTIHCISRNGFNVLPHRHSGIAYSAFLEELEEPFEINDLLRKFRKHINIIRRFGLSAEPLVDSLRPITQRVWTKLSIDDKKRFLFHLRHYWNVARHRLPIHIHDTIQNLRIQQKLIIKKGRLLDINEDENFITVDFEDKELKKNSRVKVTRVINCSGPLSSLTQTGNTLLKNMFDSGLIREDSLNLGLDAMLNGAVLNSYGKPSESIFTLGSNLRGLLWETTAVPELRVQAENLALLIIDKMEYSSEPVQF